MERTLIIAKPDALQRGLVGQIISRMEQKGLKLVGLKMMSLDSTILQAHYSHHIEKDFYENLENFMKSSPVVVMAWEGFECVESVRIVVGATNPRQAQAGTIRGDFAMGEGRNIVHASDSAGSGKEEVQRFFKDDELFKYDKSEYLHVYSPHEHG